MGHRPNAHETLAGRFRDTLGTPGTEEDPAALATQDDSRTARHARRVTHDVDTNTEHDFRVGFDPQFAIALSG